MVESSDAGAAATYRLFHQALSDALTSARADMVPPADDERALALALQAHGAGVGWQAAPVYLFRSLPGHATRAGLVDKLLTDDDDLLSTDLRRLIPSAAHATTPAGHGRARLLRLTPQAITAGPTDRAALFSVTEALEDLGSAYREGRSRLPYRAR